MYFYLCESIWKLKATWTIVLLHILEYRKDTFPYVNDTLCESSLYLSSTAAGVIVGVLYGGTGSSSTKKGLVFMACISY